MTDKDMTMMDKGMTMMDKGMTMMNQSMTMTNKGMTILTCACGVNIVETSEWSVSTFPVLEVIEHYTLFTTVVLVCLHTSCVFYTSVVCV